MHNYPDYLPCETRIFLLSSNDVDYYLTQYSKNGDQWCIDFILPDNEYDAILFNDNDFKEKIKNTSKYKKYKKELDIVIELVQKYFSLL